MKFPLLLGGERQPFSCGLAFDCHDSGRFVGLIGQSLIQSVYAENLGSSRFGTVNYGYSEIGSKRRCGRRRRTVLIGSAPTRTKPAHSLAGSVIQISEVS